MANSLELFSLKGKVAFITGASTGIGLAVARAFAQAGADIAFGYNSSPSAIETAARLSQETGRKVVAYKVPVAQSAVVEQVVQDVANEFGKIDVVVSNAGITWTSGELIEPEDHKAWQEIIDVNVNGNYYVAKAVGRVFKSQGYGSLIFTSSISAQIVNIPQRQAAYNISKAAVTSLSKNLAVEWASFARVNSVSPGYTVTEITKFADAELKEQWKKLTPVGREALPDELVGAYIYFASNASTFTTGADLVIDGGYTLV
ncbi:hypothetical protein V1514DRAFT_331576 [Lipomyces japonicus]|uniref:uncharacterized protein n=1 Tax=Lipomyces japonicus TaxID=56871 RepID=UPI0034CD9FE2